MRDLTEEELKLAPDWAAQYFIDEEDDVLFQSKNFSQWASGGKLVGLMLVLQHSRYNHATFKPIPRKTFDISEHEFGDEGLFLEHVNGTQLNMKTSDIEGELYINKQDAIAIAKALGVTGEDLK